MSWKSVTQSRYNSMKRRKSIVKMGGLPFTLDQFREYAEKFFNGKDGVVLCRYCRVPVDFQSSATDHAWPINRCGSLGLDNLQFPCAACNDRKGQLTPDEFSMLRRFLRDTFEPAAELDVMSRLEKATKLAAGKWHDMKKAAGR